LGGHICHAASLHGAATTGCDDNFASNSGTPPLTHRTLLVADLTGWLRDTIKAEMKQPGEPGEYRHHLFDWLSND